MVKTSNTEFANVGQLIAAIRKLRGAVIVDVMAGAGLDPIEVQVVKSDLLVALGGYSAEAPSPFYLHTNSHGAQFLLAAH